MMLSIMIGIYECPFVHDEVYKIIGFFSFRSIFKSFWERVKVSDILNPMLEMLSHLKTVLNKDWAENDANDNKSVNPE